MTLANDNAAEALSRGHGEGDVDYWRGIKRNACPYLMASEAERWLKKWDAAAENASETLKVSGIVVHRAGSIRAALTAAAKYLRDTEGSKEARARARVHRDLREQLETELAFLPVSATGDHDTARR